MIHQERSQSLLPAADMSQDFLKYNKCTLDLKCTQIIDQSYRPEFSFFVVVLWVQVTSNLYQPVSKVQVTFFELYFYFAQLLVATHRKQVQVALI